MPINNITQTISTIPPAGARGVDVQTQFVIKQEDFQDHLQGTTVTELNTFKDQLNSRIGEINSTVTTLNGYADTASAGASTATTKAGEASTSASEALTSKNQAETFKNNASASATKASQWADNNYNVEVETGRYSAKHWSTVAQNTAASVSNFGFKNYIINGDFRVNQYNSDTVVGITSAGVFPCDRFYGYSTQTGKVTAQIRSSGAVAMGQAQFEKCLQVLTVAGYSPNSEDSFNITQKIEGLNIANLRFGKINAKTITLSFWVRSSVIGLHSVSFKNSTANRSYVTTYTINTANKFEYKTITIQGDTTGTWEYNNGVGLHMSFSVAIGSTLSTPTPNQWVSGNYSTTAGCVNDIATTGNEFILTGIQLEEGSVATPFENRPIGLELSLCQRYFENGFFAVTAGTIGTGVVLATNIVYKNTKRISPTVSYSGVTYTGCSSITTTLNSTTLVAPSLNVSTGGYAYATGTYTASAEL